MKKIKIKGKLIRQMLVLDAILFLTALGAIVAFSEPAPVNGLKVEDSTYSTATLSWVESADAD